MSALLEMLHDAPIAGSAEFMRPPA